MSLSCLFLSFFLLSFFLSFFLSHCLSFFLSFPLFIPVCSFYLYSSSFSIKCKLVGMYITCTCECSVYFNVHVFNYHLCHCLISFSLSFFLSFFLSVFLSFSLSVFLSLFPPLYPSSSNYLSKALSSSF